MGSGVNTGLRVLLTNDDGPPGIESPYIYGFARYLVETLGWDVKVVIPSAQKSWIGNAHHIMEIIKGCYYYPRGPDGYGETSDTSRQLVTGEFAEWILLDATPATCANIALHHIFKDKIDLVISGPNYGRNSSAAFSLSSGTIGAALSSSLSLRRSIALSYAADQPPVPEDLLQPAHALAARIIQRLWQDWGKDDGVRRNGEVDLYNINIPMINGLRSNDGLRVVWTKIWRNTLLSLFQPLACDADADLQLEGPDAPPASTARPEQTESGSSFSPNNVNVPSADINAPCPRLRVANGRYAQELIFAFSPDKRMWSEVNALPPGTDAWAVERGMASVTPLRACFSEAHIPAFDLVGHEHDNGSFRFAEGDDVTPILNV